MVETFSRFAMRAGFCFSTEGNMITLAAGTEPSRASLARPYVPNRLLDVEDVRALTHVSASTIRQWINTGKIPAPLKLGKVLRWEPEQIMEWLSKAVIHAPSA